MLRIWAMQKMNRTQTLDSKLYFFVIHTQLLGLIPTIGHDPWQLHPEGYLKRPNCLLPLLKNSRLHLPGEGWFQGIGLLTLFKWQSRNRFPFTMEYILKRGYNKMVALVLAVIK